MPMELYIYVVMGQSQFIVVLAFKLFSFQNDIFNTVIANCYNCTIVLMLRNTLWAWTYHHKMCCVVLCVWLEGISGNKLVLIYSFITVFHH